MSQATIDDEAIDPTIEIEVTPVAASGPACQKCGLPSDAAACPRCGWYPSLGIHVEIDQAYEAAMQAPPEPSADGAPAEAPPKKADWIKHIEVWQGLIPAWGWLMIATTLGCFGAAVAVRLATLPSPTVQTWCGVGGLGGGLLIVFVMHIVGFVLCSFDDAQFGVSDLIIKPLKIWKQIASELPDRLWVANSGNLGLSLALASALIVGGIPYERLLDWGFKAPPKQSLVGAIADAAAQAPDNGSDSLEGAVNDFAGEAGVDGLNGVGGAPAEEKPREKLECLIIGFQANKSGTIQELLLASDVAGRLTYVGKVRPSFDADEEPKVLEKFEKHVSSRSLVKTSESGTWLRPKFTCRVTYTEWPQGMRPKNLEWDEMLDEVKLPW